MNKIILNSLLGCLILVVLAGTALGQNAEPTVEKMPPFQVGQVWSYKTRPNELKSTFVIVKIDRHAKFGDIIHIAVLDLKMKNPRSHDGISDRIGHMPFSEKAIAKSALKLVKEKSELPDFEEGYNLWKEAFDQQRAGFYSETIAEAVKITEAGLNQ